MSGGLDSTMAAVMLHEEGYEVIGMTMKTWDYQSSGGKGKETGCCSLDSINDAREVSVKMGFPHYIVDIRPDFGEHVINNFIEEYLAGRTPNPCVLCNTHIKWESMLERADAMDCEYIATGHYAILKQENDRYYVSKSKDLSKDQSYVLWGVSQESLARTMYPLGNMLKSEVRQMAIERGFDAMAGKPESYEICFVPDNDYRGFLKRKVDGLEDRVKGGEFLDQDGNVIGSHEGYPFFTIGQRKGLGKAFGEPMYVTDIDPDRNTVTLGSEEDLERSAMLVRGLNLLKYPSIDKEMESVVKVRYQHAGAAADIVQIGEKMEVNFRTRVPGIAPGQSAVFYEGDDVLGGGIIEKSFLDEI